MKYKLLKEQDFIFITDTNDKVLGYICSIKPTLPMKRNKVFNIGSVYGPKIGELLYSYFNAYYDKITPSNNVSDSAKKSWFKRFNNDRWIKTKIDDIGFYFDDNEDYLNYVYDLNKDVKDILKKDVKKINDKSKDISKEGYHLFKQQSNELYYNKDKYYTIGGSQYNNNIKLII